MPKYVLIVDDDPGNIELFQLMLRTLNVEVLSAQLGGQALEQARQMPPALVLLDLMLPDMTGFEVCAQLKASPSTAQAYIAILSARVDEAARQKALEVGADNFLVKPINRAALKTLIETALSAD
ncbi:MAG: response regulator [Aggregatilineales bacterium]